MKKKVILKKILHHDEWRYGIFFEFDKEINAVLGAIPGARFSKTYSCWYVPYNESSLRTLLSALKESADVDISAISLPSERKKADEEIPSVEMNGNEWESPEIVKNDEGTGSFGDSINGCFGPVSFSVKEHEGRLIIRFLGKYDKDWISEMKTYGRLRYDKLRKEWLLEWSQMTVDSLADYFMSRGIEVKVIRPVPTQEVKERRRGSVSGIKENTLSEEAGNGIEKVRRYLNENRYSSRSVDAYTSMLEVFFKYFHSKAPSEITEDDVSGFINDYVLPNDYSSSYQNQMISAIRIFFSLNGNSKVNILNLTRPRQGRTLPKVFSKEEVSRILKAPVNLKHKLILMLIYSCGLRRSEVINIRLRDLDRERSVLNIIEGKGKVDRIVPVAVRVWTRIDEYLKSYQPVIYLFEGQSGGRYSPESVYRIFKDAMRKAGIEKDVGVHSLRHSYATHLHESGLDIKYIQELLGHKDSRTTEIYTHVSRRNLMIIRSPVEDMDV